MTRLVSLIIPLRDIALVQQIDTHPEEETAVDDAISITMKQGRKCFVFAQLPDRVFVVEKLSEMLSKLKVFKSNHAK